MKAFLFSLLPTWLKTYKHADKIAHVIGGVIVYLCLAFVLPNHWALFLTWAVAIGVEIKDSFTYKGDFFDFLSTIIIPTILYAIKP